MNEMVRCSKVQKVKFLRSTAVLNQLSEVVEASTGTNCTREKLDFKFQLHANVMLLCSAVGSIPNIQKF